MEKKFEPIPDFGDLFTMEDFKELVKHNWLMDCDGSGCYATEDSYLPNVDVDLRNIDGTYSHVIWFNK